MACTPLYGASAGEQRTSWGILLSPPRGTKMHGTSEFNVTNLLLARLTASDLLLIRPHLEHVDLKQGEMLASAHERPSHAYFPESGLGSVIGRADGRIIEIGIFGREGMTPVSLLLGSETTPHASQVQMDGAAWRIPSDRLVEALGESPTLKALMLRYAHAFHVQVAETAMANGLLTIEQRLARWLVICADSGDDGDVRLTHDALAAMLAVHRPGVTLALQALEGRGMIRARRGRITLLDRVSMLRYVGEDYGRAEAEYRRLLG